MAGQSSRESQEMRGENDIVSRSEQRRDEGSMAASEGARLRQARAAISEWEGWNTDAAVSVKMRSTISDNGGQR